MSKSNPRFDADGRKLYTANSPLYVGTRTAGPPAANAPRWLASVQAAWTRVEARDARRRVYDAARERGELLTPLAARNRVVRELHRLQLPFTIPASSIPIDSAGSHDDYPTLGDSSAAA